MEKYKSHILIKISMFVALMVKLWTKKSQILVSHKLVSYCTYGNTYVWKYLSTYFLCPFWCLYFDDIYFKYLEYSECYILMNCFSPGFHLLVQTYAWTYKLFCKFTVEFTRLDQRYIAITLVCGPLFLKLVWCEHGSQCWKKIL